MNGQKEKWGCERTEEGQIVGRGGVGGGMKEKLDGWAGRLLG